MGLADELERRLERVVDGFFSRTFRSRIQPAEIGRRLLREMEGGKSVSVGAVYVPNRYTIRLAPDDHRRFEGLVPALQKEFVELLAQAARERRWRFPGALRVAFEEAAGVSEGRFEVEALHDASTGPEHVAEPVAALWMVGADPARRWELESDTAVVGRLPSCDIVLSDSNASRRHAELGKREDGWWVTDLASTNGTLVNGVLVKERRLEPGDLIQIGATELEFREEWAPGAEPEGSTGAGSEVERADE